MDGHAMAQELIYRSISNGQPFGDTQQRECSIQLHSGSLIFELKNERWKFSKVEFYFTIQKLD